MEKSSLHSLIYLRAVVRPAILLVLLLHFNHLPSITELARLLALQRRTVARYLRQLKRLGLIQPEPKGPGYVLSENLNAEALVLLDMFTPDRTQAPPQPGSPAGGDLLAPPAGQTLISKLYGAGDRTGKPSPPDSGNRPEHD